MSLFVVDSSVVLKWVFPEPGHKEALALLAQWVGGKIDLLAPRLMLSETASVLCKSVRRKYLSTEKALEAFALLEENYPPLSDDNIPAALGLALAHHLSFWDAIYVALVIERRCDLITADRRLYLTASRCYPHVRMLGEDL